MSPRAAFVERASGLIEDVEWLLAAGETDLERIAQRCGTTPLALHRRLYRWHRNDLIRRMHGYTRARITRTQERARLRWPRLHDGPSDADAFAAVTSIGRDGVALDDAQVHRCDHCGGWLYGNQPCRTGELPVAIDGVA